MFWIKHLPGRGEGKYRVQRLDRRFTKEGLNKVWIVTKQKAEQDHVACV